MQTPALGEAGDLPAGAPEEHVSVTRTAGPEENVRLLGAQLLGVPSGLTAFGRVAVRSNGSIVDAGQQAGSLRG